MIIDFHTHSFPEKIAASAIKSMQRCCHAKAWTEGTLTALEQASCNAGIDIALLQPVATKAAQVESINSLSIGRNGTDGIMCFGCIHPDYDDYIIELERIAANGIKGVKIHPVYQGADLDDLRYLHIFEHCAELGLWVLTHAGDDIGYPGTVRCSPEMIRNALVCVPGLKMVAAHMGGWRNWERVTDCLAETDVYLDTAFSLGCIYPLDDGYYADKDTSLLSDEKFCELVRTFGAERVLFGSDSPWTEQRSEIEHIRALPLAEYEKTAILGGNAKKILFG